MTKAPLTALNLVECSEQRAREAVFPAHQQVCHWLRKTDSGIVVPIPESLVQVQKLPHWGGEKILQTPMHGLKLDIRPVADPNSNKSWIKRVYICSRITQLGGRETVAGYKREPGYEDDIFQVITQFCLRSDHNTTILFWAIGPQSHAALSAGLDAEIGFNPSEWDLDGYYEGPASKSQTHGA